MTPGLIWTLSPGLDATGVVAPAAWQLGVAAPRGAGPCRRCAALFVAGALLVGLGTAAANPWGLPVEADGSRGPGARAQAPQGPDWIQGANPPTAAQRAPVGVSAPPRSADSRTDAGRYPPAEPPTWGGRWSPTGGPGPGDASPLPWAPAPPDPFPADRGDSDPAAAPRAGPPGYRFRGDPSPPGGGAAAWSDAGGGYRFRPLTEREQARQGRGPGPSPAAPGHPSGTPPTWAPGGPGGFSPGPWPAP